MSSSQLFVIGDNVYHNLGLNQFDEVCGLTINTMPRKNIFKAFLGYSYTIYTDDSYDDLYSAGYNDFGSCGVEEEQTKLKPLTPITYFDKHGIKIKQISVNPWFISYKHII